MKGRFNRTITDNNKQKEKTMETLGYIYAAIQYVFEKKFSVDETLEMIRTKLLEQGKST